MKRILDPSFRYVKAVDTDIRKTFRRERDRLKAEKQKQDANTAEVAVKVRVFHKAKP